MTNIRRASSCDWTLKRSFTLVNQEQASGLFG